MPGVILVVGCGLACRFGSHGDGGNSVRSYRTGRIVASAYVFQRAVISLIQTNGEESC